MRIQQWLGEHGTKIVGYAPPHISSPIQNDSNINNIAINEEWHEHKKFFDYDLTNPLPNGLNLTNPLTFSCLPISTLNVNSMIVNEKIKARKVLRQEMKSRQIICLLDVRIKDGDTQNLKQLHSWARENIKSHPKLFFTALDNAKEGGAL